MKRVGSGVATVVLACALACTPAKVATPPSAPPASAISLDQKHAWVMRLEQQRVARDPAEPAADLLVLARDRDVFVRRQAMLALGRSGLTEGTPVLTSALSDPDEYTRAMAAFSLGLLGDKSTVPALTDALRDASPIVRGRAAEALGLIGDQTAASSIAERSSGCAQQIASIAPDDEQWPKSADVEACRLALFALVRLKSYDALARVALDAQGQPVSRWWPVAYALQRIGDRRAADALASLASGTDTYSRAFALRGLAAAGDRRAGPLAVTIAGSTSSDVKLRVAAVRALAQLKSTADLPALLAIANDGSAPLNLAVESVTAIGTIGGAEAFEPLLNLWTSPSPTVRAAAIAATAKVNPSGFVLVVSSLTPDKEWSVRAALAGVFRTLPPDQVRSAVEDLCDDPDNRVRVAALDALAQIGAPDLATRLTAALDAPDVVLRATAARLIGEKKLPDGVPRLVAAYARGAADGAYSARAAALDALSKYGGDEALTTIRRGLQDPDWAVRIKAADLLHAAGDPAATPATPAPLRLPAATFESSSLLHPQFSPHAYLETKRGVIELELNVIDAPVTVNAFIERARAGKFDGLRVHRVVPNFVLQTGDPRGDGEGGPDYTLRDELSPVPYLRGTVGMALEWRETGGSQFFITVSPQPHLDAKYTAFGHVVGGMELLDQITQDDVIERVRIWDGTK